MSEELQEFESGENDFWNHATKYTTAGNPDEPFVNEIAYMMITLHKSGS